MRGYNLFVKFYSPMVFYHLPVFDSIIAYCLAREMDRKRSMVFVQRPQQVPEREIESFQKIIEHHTPFYPVPMSSYLMPIDEPIDFLDSWKKRFDSKHSNIADFGKARRRIHTGSGPYRSYNMPLPAKIIQVGYFAFIGDGERILELIKNNLVGIGKKISEGFGWIDNVEIKEIDYTCFDIARMRPVPIEMAEKHKIIGRKMMAGWKSPYWLRENICECVVPG